MDYLTDKIQKIANLKSGVKRLTLTEFRNYATLRINTDLQPVIITGKNGSGKTNILEAISLLTPGRGLRSAKLSELKRIVPVTEQAEFLPPVWSIAADILHNNEEITIGTTMQRALKELENDEEYHSYDRRIIQIDQQKISQQGELGKYISAIWLTPQMERLFQGGAQPRRSFLDRLVYAFDLEHAKRVSSFEHLYRQWLQILKSGKYDIRWLQSLESEMATYGVAIAAARREQIARLNTFIKQESDDVFPDVSLVLEGTIERMLDTKPALQVEDFYADLFVQNRHKILYNDTVDGINKTDFKVFYKAKNMPAELCSTGEQKALLISIILLQTKCQILDRGFSPVLLLDEVTSHLDAQKRSALLAKIRDLHLQAWITSTEEQNFTELRNFAQFIQIADGKIV